MADITPAAILLHPRLTVPHHVIPIGITVQMSEDAALNFMIQAAISRLTKQEREDLAARRKYLRLLQFQDKPDEPEDRVCAIYTRPVSEMLESHKKEYDLITETLDSHDEKCFIGEISYSLTAYFFEFDCNGTIIRFIKPASSALEVQYFMNNDINAVLSDYVNWWRENGVNTINRLRTSCELSACPEAKTERSSVFAAQRVSGQAPCPERSERTPGYNLLADVNIPEITRLTQIINMYDDKTRAQLLSRLDTQIKAEQYEAKLNGEFECPLALLGGLCRGSTVKTTFIGFGCQWLRILAQNV